MKDYKAQLIDTSGDRIRHLVFDVPEFTFQAGQYITFNLGDTFLPLSIASAPRRLPELHFYYRSTPGDPAAAAFDQHLANTDLYTISAAAGNVCSRETGERLLLVAAGTGISQAHSLLDAQQPQDPSATLLWCVSSPADKQTQDLLILSQARYATNIVVDDRQGSANKGVRWLVERMNSFGLHRKILCGPPGFVYAVVDALEQAGFDASDIEADAFSYAPRPAP